MQRDFFLGSEWLYYKIYTGIQTTDVILMEKLHPVILKLERKQIIQKWFFIRYKDPDHHLRIRFLIPKTDHLPKVINAIYSVLKELVEQNVIWRIQTDTYKRELERYGEKTIELSEFLFWKDSEMMLEYISIKQNFHKKETVLFFSFYAIDSFLNTFAFTNFEKYSLMQNLQNSFKEEFNADIVLKKQLDKNYRKLSNDIISILNRNVKNEYNDVFKVIDNKEFQILEQASEIKDKIQLSLSDFITSHIHMMINRQYTSRQRMYELIIYDHLYRFYKTLNYKAP